MFCSFLMVLLASPNNLPSTTETKLNFCFLMTSLLCLCTCVLALVLLLVPDVDAGNPLRDPPSPEMYAVVECYTSIDGQQPIVIEVYSNWSPRGAERFVDLVEAGYYDQSPIYRVAKKGRGWGFVTQFGISLDKELEREWKDNTIPDDPNLGFSFDRGDISFYAEKANSRTTQVMISYSDTTTRALGSKPWETPFGKVVVGMNIADEFYDGGEFRKSMDLPPRGQGPDPKLIRTRGRPYLKEKFPKLTYIDECKVVEDFRDQQPTSFQRRNNKKNIPVFQVQEDDYDNRKRTRDERRRKLREKREEREERKRNW